VVGVVSPESALSVDLAGAQTSAITVSATNTTSTSHSLVSADIVVTFLAARPPCRMSLCDKRDPHVRRARLPL